MKKYKFLALTDHSGHSMHNSLYALMASLAAHPQCATLYVASRGNKSNQDFFDQKTTKINAVLVDASFAYQEDQKQFLEDQTLVDFQDFDVVMMRLPRPISDSFLGYLNQIGPDITFVNNPLGIIKTSTKKFLTNFPEVCPDIKLCHSKKEVIEFAQKFPIVLKPLKEYGGKGIVKINGNTTTDGNNNLETNSYLKTIEKQLKEDGYLAMKFLKNVSQGDKRILVVNGEILAGSLRLPAADSWLCNVAQGGTSVSTTITKEEELMIKKITPILLENGIVVFGADTLVDDDGKRILSEINTLSIGGFPQAAVQTGKPIVQMAINNIIDYINNKK